MSRISLASCRAVCSPALVEILVEVILGWTDFGLDCLVLWYSFCFRVLIVVVGF